MAISFRRYIDITSGVGAGVRVPGRELIGRIYTSNPLAPTDTVIEFDEAREVADFFGASSEEYKRAAFYFGFISKTQVRPRKISFERFVPDAAAATLRGVHPAPELAAFKAVANGSLALTLEDNMEQVLALDFTGATSYADVASIIESGIRAANSDPLWANAIVTFDAQTKTFTLSSGQPGRCAIEPASEPDVGTPIAGMLRWTAGSGALASAGHDAVTVTETLNRSIDQSNNFGSYLFLGDFTLEQMAEAAVIANLSNVQFMYCQRVSVEDYAAAREALKGYNGVALTEYDPARSEEYPEMAPMILLAATDYTRLNGTLNYMFHQFGLTPTVQDNAKANLMDEARVNYYGRTQQAGQIIDFYQRGVLQGEIQDMNIYANEMWLKDQAGAAVMTLKLALPKISANASGQALVMGCLRSVIDMAIKNGTISINKQLNFTQKAFIYQVTGDDTAWVQVQSQGYWLRVEVQEYTVDDRIEYKVVYLLIYSKDDIIRKTEGTHSLI